ncbi:ralBP1-associated Eps domain-containing protein 1-like isoform X1 [Biomphalaria glabrata]|uniref:RalBP1-associated Eps domain-containing protein 1-like isoform X1 n=1 Tax=Biomphalaria glabrata TaxID=6526 RepID=A0A9W3ALP3_BIOGL|nr:ralBP1-associated Eps domain-containing protein 1-like isoform X1 [Biomphalaria glabrata]
MEKMNLQSREQQYYAELFQACDVEGSGKISGPKASELFMASGLNPEILKQITELCGAKRLGHFGRSQFYIALKLVALAQSGQPVKLDALNSGKELPLPKFSSKGNDQMASDRKKSSGEPDSAGLECKLNSQLSGQLPPPPGSKKSHSRSLSGQYRGVVHDPPSVVTSQSGQFPTQTSLRDDSPHNSKSPPFSPTQSPPTSPANQKSLIKQHTAPALVFANSQPNLASAAVASHPSSMTSSLESAEATRHLVNPNSMSVEGGHVNPVALSEVTVPPRVAATVNSGPVGGSSHHHHPQSGGAGVENGNWTMFDDEESHMLIGSGVKQHYNNLEPPNFDSSSISSEADSVDDIWSINDEQREYYVNQFKTMQPDLNAFITGPVAKHFFEKSKLPVIELSKIWQLSDLNCDGALSLEEFCIAMHLVVLRRNDIELPDHLPVSLMPYSTLTSDEPFAADLPPGSTLKRATPPSPHSNVAQWTAFGQESPDSNGVPSPAHLVNFEFSKPSADPDLKIVQPVPVHMLPEALQNEGYDRGRAFSDSSVPHESCGTDHGDSSPPLYKQRAYTEIHHQDPGHLDSPNSKYSTPIQGRPRPVPPKKNSVNTVPAVLLGQLQPPPGTCPEGTAVPGSIGYPDRPSEVPVAPGHGPPTPPPRPPHGRSMSMDVKLAPQLVAPAVPQLVAPAVPPRISPKEVSHVQSFSQKPSDPGVIGSMEHRAATKNLQNVIQTHRRSVSLGIKLGYPSVPPELPPVAHVVENNETSFDKEKAEERETTPDSSVKERLQSKPTLTLRQGSRDKRDIHMAVRTHKERNSMLTRLNSELNQELQEVMEQRIALEIQLEHLRPFSS